MEDKVVQSDTKPDKQKTDELDNLPFDIGDLTPQQVKAVVLLSEVPSRFKNQTELATECGTTRNTLYLWQKKPEFKEALEKMSKWHFMHVGHLVRTGHLKSCIKGNPQAIKLYYQYVENWSEKTILEHEGTGVALPTTVNVNLGDPKAIEEATGVDLTKKPEAEKTPTPPREATEPEPA